ncbi:MAG: serine--tRNA ligase [Coprobacillus sp. 28_7]|nr:MAG: serine--tRNA ligase [Coprobacillus sp. 28_7]
MLDIKFVRENPEIVKENIKKKFQDKKLPLVDEVIALDSEIRRLKQEGDALRQERNASSQAIGKLMREKNTAEAEKMKANVVKINETLVSIEKVIPNIIDKSVPIGKDDTFNVENKRYGEPFVPEYEIPYHADIIAKLNGLDKESAGRTSGNGFYYLLGDVARLHSAMLSYARDFMINKGFTYCVPPFMIHSDVVNGVMSFEEMGAMMYKIEGEDLYLIGTSEHSMIGRFKDQIIPEKTLPLCLTSYSPCFRKEVGAHGIEERGIYRVHQFEKQEMVVLCKAEESMEWYEKMYNFTVEFFRSMDVPVRTLECCSGDLADLKVKSCDVEAWSPRQKKYFEVGSCSTLGDAQARRLSIRAKGSEGTYLVHTLNNTVLATPRGLIAVLENNYNEDGSIRIPEALQPYMCGTKVIMPK